MQINDNISLSNVQNNPDNGEPNQPSWNDIAKRTKKFNHKSISIIKLIGKVTSQFKNTINWYKKKISSRIAHLVSSRLTIPDNLLTNKPHKYLTKTIQCILKKDCQGMVKNLKKFEEKFLEHCKNQSSIGADDTTQFFDDYTTELFRNEKNRQLIKNHFNKKHSPLRETFADFQHLFSSRGEIDMNHNRGNLMSTAINFLNVLASKSINGEFNNSGSTNDRQEESQPTPFENFINDIYSQLDKDGCPPNQKLHRNLINSLLTLSDCEKDGSTLQLDNTQAPDHNNNSHIPFEQTNNMTGEKKGDTPEQ